MKGSIVVVSLLPFVIDIVVKLVNNFIDPPLMRKALGSLVSLPKPKGEEVVLDGNQQKVIVAHISHESLKTATIMTTLASFFAAVLILWNTGEKLWPLVLLTVLFVFALILVGWTLTKDVAYMRGKNRFRLRRDTSLVLVLCAYDVLSGALTVLAR